MEKPHNKIGVAITTFNRPEYYNQVISSIPQDRVEYIVVVNDGAERGGAYVNAAQVDRVIVNQEQSGIAVCKNQAIRYLLEKDCEHLFIIEDDIIVKDPNVFDEYIKAANSTGIHHLCFEKVAGNEKTLVDTLLMSDGTKIGFYKNPQGAFMYINANLIKKLGYFDEGYTNAFEHIDFAYNLIQKKVAPPFWYFPDILNSDQYLEEIKGSPQNSTITNKERYQENLEKSAQHFIKKWGHFTADIPVASKGYLDQTLIHLLNAYSRKKLVNKGRKLSIIIPYRDRELALKTLIPSLQNYVSKQVEEFDIVIVEQNNDKPFNKGLLNNIGFALCNADCDYVCFHDVDLIPELADYSYPAVPSHISSHCSQFNYVNIPDRIMGGVVLFNNKDYREVNGYSNEFAGWGKEDDDLYHRCHVEILTPYKHPYGRFFSIPHTHRLTNPIENAYHLKNGKRFRDFESGKLGFDYHKKDGYNNCLDIVGSSNITTKEMYDNVEHILVKF